MACLLAAADAPECAKARRKAASRTGSTSTTKGGAVLGDIGRDEFSSKVGLAEAASEKPRSATHVTCNMAICSGGSLVQSGSACNLIERDFVRRG